MRSSKDRQYAKYSILYSNPAKQDLVTIENLVLG